MDRHIGRVNQISDRPHTGMVYPASLSVTWPAWPLLAVCRRCLSVDRQKLHRICPSIVPHLRQRTGKAALSVRQTQTTDAKSHISPSSLRLVCQSVSQSCILSLVLQLAHLSQSPSPPQAQHPTQHTHVLAMCVHASHKTTALLASKPPLPLPLHTHPRNAIKPQKTACVWRGSAVQ